MDKAVSTGATAGPQEFKQQIYAQLKKAGVVSSLKSQLRTQLLEQLRKLAGPDAGKAAGSGLDQARTMWHSALNCMLAQYLEAAGCQFTLSVFISETDLPGQTTFSDEELCQLLRLDRQPVLLQRVQELLPSTGCLALALLQALSSTGGGPSTIDSGCQTSSRGQIEGLKGRLLQLEDTYMAKAAHKAATDPHYSMEQQMAAYKKECEELMELQLAARLARFKEVELATARQEAAAKHRQQLEADRVELERIHADRLARLAAREEEISEKLRRQQRDVESIAYTQRQRILAEEERIRGMKAEVGRQLEVQEQLLKGLEAQLKEREKAVSAREVAAESKLAGAAELEAKLAAAARKDAQAALAEEAAALRGERVALESERSRLAELRVAVNTDLAVARAQEDRLRSLETARAEAEARSAAHAAGEEVLRLQLNALQQEAGALQQELVRAGAAAGAAAAAAGGPELYPATVAAVAGPPLQLPQALRELGQWQRRAQQAELALDQLTVERDTAQSRADELMLDLNAARREIAAVRSQLARQQQDIVQLKLQLSQANAAVAAAAASGSRLGLGLGLGSRPASRAGVGSPTRSTAGGAAAAQSTARPVSAQYIAASHGVYSSGGAGSPAVVQQLQQGSPRMAAAAGRPGSSQGGADIWTAAAAAGAQRSLAFGSPQHQLQRLDGAAVVYLPVGGAAGSLAGAAQESQARLAQLSAADASMTAQLADFRRRSTAQRAAAARQLDDLRAAAGSSGGGAAAAGRTSSGGGAVQGQRVQQQQCRLSIPSEFGGSDFGCNASELDAQASQELQQYQQRRVALEHALEPHYTRSYVLQQQQQQQQQQTGPWQQQEAYSANPAAVQPEVKLYPLSDALAPGGVAAKGYVQQLQQQMTTIPWPQQQEQQRQQASEQQSARVSTAQPSNKRHEQQQQQQQQQQQHSTALPAESNVGSSTARPPSSSTEFSFVQQPKCAQNAAAASFSIPEEEEVHSAASEASATQLSSSEQQAQHVAQDVCAAAAAAAGLQQGEVPFAAARAAPSFSSSSSSSSSSAAAAAAAEASDAASQPQPTAQQSRICPDFSTPSPDVGSVELTVGASQQSGTAVPSAVIDSVIAAGAVDVEVPGARQAASGSDTAANVAEGTSQGAAAVESSIQAQQGSTEEQVAPEEQVLSEDEDAKAQDGIPSEELCSRDVQDADTTDEEFDAELSAISSAVAIEAAAAAAGLEGVRLSGSSMGNLSGSAADRYASWAGADYSDEAEDESGYAEAPNQQRQQQEGYTGLQGMQHSGHLAQHPSQQRDAPSSPGWLGSMHDYVGDAGGYVADDASSKAADGSGTGEGTAAMWQQELQSPGSSAGSVF